MTGGNRQPSGVRRRALGAAAAVALVGIYLGIAAAAHLAPWPGKNLAASPASSRGASATSPAEASAAASAAPSPDPSPDPGTSPASPAEALRNLIPGDIQADGCPTGKLLLGAIAVRNCSGVSYGPGKTGAQVSYYLFAGNKALDKAYADFLTATHVPRASGNCGNFRSFRPPCETAIRNRTPLMTGRAVEYTHQGFADIVSSDEQQHVLVWVTAKDGQAMLAWWVYPERWLVTG